MDFSIVFLILTAFIQFKQRISKLLWLNFKVFLYFITQSSVLNSLAVQLKKKFLLAKRNITTFRICSIIKTSKHRKISSIERSHCSELEFMEVQTNLNSKVAYQIDQKCKVPQAFYILKGSMKKQGSEVIKKMKLDDYEIGRTLGKGGFGKVKIAKNKKTGKYVALKLLNKGDIIKSQQVDHVYNENFVHSQINHPFIVHFEGLAQDTKYLYLVLELINGGELFTYLRSVETFPTQQAKFYAATVASSFEYLHSKNIIFRDLKPENLLIANDGYLKLTDFGFAKILNQGRTFTICGTPEYIAPEVILNQGHGKAVDWWTLGVLIYEMHAGIDPFNDDDPMGIYKNILRGKIQFPSSFDKDAKSLVKHLLVADLSKRYGNLKDGVNDIKKHRWFNTLSWDDLLKKKIKPPYVPVVKSPGDVSNFDDYPDSGSHAQDIKASSDPFINW